jgi:hypothetical protein
MSRWKRIGAMTQWVKRQILPPPVYINGQRYWSSEQLDEHDRVTVAVAHEQRRLAHRKPTETIEGVAR